jgi:hypothetical protein
VVLSVAFPGVLGYWEAQGAGIANLDSGYPLKKKKKKKEAEFRKRGLGT